jgi:site-specific DNA-methyltransferase (adenine-specific)
MTIRQKKSALPANEIVSGDALAVMKDWPEAAVDCIVTSPPYWQQRDYRGAMEQVGQERKPQDYVQRLTTTFRECRRVMQPTGTLWLVIGDKYVGGEQLGLPWRVALSLIDDGWILRADCIWHKPNAMPSSAKSRPTIDHEYIFFFSKSKDYYYDADAVREPHVTFSEKSRMRGGRNHFGVRGGTPEAGKNGGSNNLHNGRWDQAFHPLGRNKRTVWSIPLSKFRDAHFAVFPESLVETCIRAGCPAEGLVLDPFVGSGTVPLVARRLGRRYVGIDCVEEYCEMARQRLNANLPLKKRSATSIVEIE